MSIARIAKLAERDFAYIKANVSIDNPDATKQLLRRLFDVCHVLAKNPHAGQRCENLRAHLRQFTSEDYVIYYYPARGDVRIALVLHGSRDTETVLLRRLR